MAKYRAVFHLNESNRARADLVMRSVEHLIQGLGQDNVEVELVATAEAVNALLKWPNLHGDRIAGLQAKGVRVVVCGLTVEAEDLHEDTLLDGVEIVPVGVAELVKRQAEGWAYVRP